jgi:hypothetical protein
MIDDLRYFNKPPTKLLIIAEAHDPRQELPEVL